MTRSSCADRGRAARRRLLATTGLVLLAVSPSPAADRRLRYDFGISEIYSEDVLRIGADEIDDYITSVAFTGGLEVTTEKSRSEFVYTPTYFSYDEFSDLDNLDHRYRGTWDVRPGPRSTIGLNQGFSRSTRQAGFTDLDGAASEAGQPVIGVTRRTAWEIEPRWDFNSTQRTTVSLQGLYRSEGYDRSTLIDTGQAALEGSVKVAVSRSQSVGTRVRGDRYRFSGGAADDTAPVYNQFLSALLTWGMATTDRFSLDAGAGVFRGTGRVVEPTLGPTADLSGEWHWRRSLLRVTVGVGFSSGGGINTVNRSERGDINYNVVWGRGFEAGVNGTYIVRDPVEETGEETLKGRSFALVLQKTWQPGWGLGGGISGLRQEQNVGLPLSYREVTVGLIYRPPVRPLRAPEPTAPAVPGS